MAIQRRNAMKRTILAAALLVPALVFAQPRGAIVTDKV